MTLIWTSTIDFLNRFDDNRIFIHFGCLQRRFVPFACFPSKMTKLRLFVKKNFGEYDWGRCERPPGILDAVCRWNDVFLHIIDLISSIRLWNYLEVLDSEMTTKAFQKPIFQLTDQDILQIVFTYCKLWDLIKDHIRKVRNGSLKASSKMIMIGTPIEAVGLFFF